MKLIITDIKHTLTKSGMNNYFSDQDTSKRQNELKWLKEASYNYFIFSEKQVPVVCYS